MFAQLLSQQADFAAATTRGQVPLGRAPARRVGGWCAVCAVLMLTASSAFAQMYQWTNFVGMPGGVGNVDGTGSAAWFYQPSAVAVDGSGIYVADTSNHTIRKVTSGGVVTTLAGLAGSKGSSDGTGTAARFNYPQGIAVDSSGNIYVADSNNNTIRKVTPAGVVTTLAGQAGTSGSNDGPSSTARFWHPAGVAVDGSGNVYVADSNNNTIRQVVPGAGVFTVAGKAGSSGSTNGSGASARFHLPNGVAVDGSGNLYVADYGNHTIRKVTSGGIVSTLAGQAGSFGSSDGTGSAALFDHPAGVTVDSSRNVYVADQGNNTIRKVTSAGVVSTLAGLAGRSGSSDGTGTAALFSNPTGVAVDSSGKLYVADQANNTIRKMGSTVGAAVTTLAGLAGSYGSSDGTGSTALFTTPNGAAVDSSGNVYVADSNNHTIRMVTPGGVVSTLAGLAGSSGSSDGTGSAARFYFPSGVAVDGSGNVYVADQWNNTIRKITPGGVVSTLAGLAGNSGSSDGTGSAARFWNPSSVALDSSGNIYIADQYNNTVRMVTPGGVVTTLAGLAGSIGSSDGTGSAARFYQPSGVAVDVNGNVYVADQGNKTIRMVTPGGAVTTLAGLAGSGGSSDGTGSAAQFGGPSSVAVDGSGNVYVADQINNTIRLVTPAGVVTTIGGTAGVASAADGIGAAAWFNAPAGLAVSSAGTVFVADSNNNRISMGVVLVPPVPVTAAASAITSTGATLNGTVNASGFSTAVSFDYGLTTAYGTNVPVAPVTGGSATAVSVVLNGLNPGTTYHFRVNGTNSGGTVNGSDQTFTTDGGPPAQYSWTNFAGMPKTTGSADGTGSAARFDFPVGVAVDASGSIYVADTQNSTIRKITPGGVASTLAGLAGNWGSSDGTGSTAQFYQPSGVAVDGSGNVYVADTINNTIRKVTPGRVVTTLAGAGFLNNGSSDGTGSAARFDNPTGVAVDSSGNVYVADSNNSTIRKVTPAGVVTTLAGLAGITGSSDGTGSAARFNFPQGVVVDGSGNVYVADSYNNTIRMITPGGGVSTLAGMAGSLNRGSSDGTGSAAQFYNPTSLALDGSGNIYVTDQRNCTIRKVTPAGVVSTIGGTPYASGAADGIGAAAVFGLPQGIAVTGTGTVFVADTWNSRISMGVVVPVPFAVTAPATSISGTGATLNGTASANGFNTVVSFDYGPTTAYGTTVTATPGSLTGSNVTAVSAVITGLSPGLLYHFRVNGTSSQGTNLGSDQAFFTSTIFPSARTLAAASISDTGATLNGTVNANGYSTAASFEYGLTTAYGTTVTPTPSPVTGTSDTAVSAVLTGLSPGTTYHFRVSGTISTSNSSSSSTTHGYGSDQTFTTAASTPTSWRQQWFSTTSNSGTAADTADPFNTGVPNLVSFALLGPTQNPATVTAAMLPQPQNSGGNLVYTFTEPAGVSNINYGAQYTTTLTPANWQPVTDTGSGTQHIFSVPIGSNTQIFMRLTLTNLGP